MMKVIVKINIHIFLLENNESTIFNTKNIENNDSIITVSNDVYSNNFEYSFINEEKRIIIIITFILLYLINIPIIIFLIFKSFIVFMNKNIVIILPISDL